MLRWLTPLALAAVVVSAFALYWIKHDTRQLADRVKRTERLIEAAEGDIALLKAELATLTRPRRIEPLARRHLGLAPLEPRQLGAIADIPLKDELEPPAPPGGQAP